MNNSISKALKYQIKLIINTILIKMNAIHDEFYGWFF